MKIKKFNDFSLNERYKVPKINNISDVFNLPYTYIDKVFDNLQNILMEVHQVSEKSFTQLDQLKNYLELYFDNNQEILLKIDKLRNENKREKFIAEILYYEYFQNNLKAIEEKLNNKND